MIVGMEGKRTAGTRPRPRRTLAAISAVAGAGLLVLSAVGVDSAHADGPTQHDLCDGYGGAHGCRLVTDDTTINLGNRVGAVAWGNPGVDVQAVVYLVEFNSAGAITGLVPASAPVAGRTTTVAGGQGQTFFERSLVPYQPAGHPSGGWLFLGLADDSSPDLRGRIGTLIKYGGDTVRSLGDGYAAQKPAGEPLDLDVIGFVNGASYWIEYLDDRGRWRPLPGQGYDHAQRLSGADPTERQQLTYTIPTSLTRNKSYQFRINTDLNYGGSVDRPVAKPAYVEWTVIPSSTPLTQERGHDFNPDLAPGEPDDEPSSSPSPSTSATATPTSKPTSTPTSTPSTRPTADQTATAGPTQTVGASPGATPTAGSSGTSTGSADPQPADPTTSAAPPAAAASSAGVGSGTSGAPTAVWGNEAPVAQAVSPALPASSGTSRLLALLGVALLVAPAAWWLANRRRDRRRDAEPLL
jgi:hypothetical protein